MKTYEVTITETLQKTVIVEAVSREQAQEIIEQKWKDCDYVLDADDFVDVDFTAVKVKERNHNFER